MFDFISKTKQGVSMLKSESQIPFAKFGTMPVDFTSYLLASSPPASSFEFLNFSQHLDNTRLSLNGYVYKDSSIASSICALKQRKSESNYQKKNRPELKPIITNLSSSGEEDGQSTSADSQSPTPPTSPGKSKKKVSFADHRGMALACVKIMTEPSDVPPKIKEEVLAAVRQGATAGVSDQPPLVINFPQPASDYLAFRDLLEQNCVSLENVIIRDYKVLGTIKVKNISFEKRVFVRVTFDSWENCLDVEGVFLQGQPSASNNIDTFSFEFDVPTDLDRNSVVEFAVCFEANSQQYWDNRKGENYKITICSETSFVTQPDGQNITEDKPLKNVDSWTEYASWNKVDTTIPYW
ncbi:protein phosphatase 1 regulatory subunit 3B-like [Mytilus californianus]|uniref:protein phosphatase 1 regulatory subunit 3B-like n=1 Tax=Mytilus californianus TaxID=6549 RepID=UPI002246C62E|nr:protein phosphatase 1 regulatory subunit 3B-like [Mytilus californianus]